VVTDRIDEQTEEWVPIYTSAGAVGMCHDIAVDCPMEGCMSDAYWVRFSDGRVEAVCESLLSPHADGWLLDG
jgi:hypothetical protein